MTTTSVLFDTNEGASFILNKQGIQKIEVVPIADDSTKEEIKTIVG